MLFRGVLGDMYSGAVSGLVASHCNGSTYFRARAVPTNPNSSRQMAMREAIDEARANWQAFTSAERDYWDAFAASLRRSNRIGQRGSRTGFNEYVRWASPRIFANAVLGTTVEDVSSVPQVPEAWLSSPPTGQIVADLFRLNFNTTDWWVNEENSILLLWLSAARSSTDPPAYRILPATINYFRGPWRLAGFSVGSGGGPSPSSINVTLPRAPDIGESVRWKVRLSSTNNGYSGEYQGVTYAA